MKKPIVTNKPSSVLFRCTFSGCGVEQFGYTDNPPRHNHGKAMVEMRPPVIVNGLHGSSLVEKYTPRSSGNDNG